MRRTTWLWLAATLLLGTGLPAAEEARESDPAGPAIAAAKAWLQTVDAGDYARSWKEAAAFFQAKVTEEQWREAIAGARKPLGKPESRSLSTQESATELPGAPDGDYVLLGFETTFESKKKAAETVTVMKEKDGSWRVAGYFVRQNRSARGGPASHGAASANT